MHKGHHLGRGSGGGGGCGGGFNTTKLYSSRGKKRKNLYSYLEKKITVCLFERMWLTAWRETLREKWLRNSLTTR